MYFDMLSIKICTFFPFVLLLRSWVSHFLLTVYGIFVIMFNGCILFHQVNHPVLKNRPPCGHLGNSRSCFIFPLWEQQLTPQWSSSKENIFILLNQIIPLDKFPRDRIGRPKNMGIFMDFPLCCNIAFAKKIDLTVYTGNCSMSVYSFSSVMFTN